MRISFLPAFLILITAQLLQAQTLLPVRQAVDIYNTVGTTSRLIAFMKIGSEPRDLQYLNYLNARLSNQALPKAYLSGTVIYFRGLDEPLKILDLRNKLFSYRGRKIDLSLPGGVAVNLSALEKALGARSADYFFFDWIFPFAYATSTLNPAAGASAMLAVGGLTESMQCLGGESSRCANHFMGTLGVLGAVGGFSGAVPSTQVFCSRDVHGDNKFVIAGQTRSVRAMQKEDGGLVILPRSSANSAKTAQSAAGELIAACASPQSLNAVNIALAYPSSPADPVLPARQVAVQAPPIPAEASPAVPPRAPAYNSRAPASVEPTTGGTAR